VAAGVLIRRTSKGSINLLYNTTNKMYFDALKKKIIESGCQKMYSDPSADCIGTRYFCGDYILRTGICKFETGPAVYKITVSGRPELAE